MPERIKKSLREEVLIRRNAIPASEREARSRLISTRLIEQASFKKSDDIMFYVAFGSEPDCGLAMEYALDTGKRAYVPDNISILEVKRCGVFRGDPGKVSLVVVPAIALDPNGHRIGYGGGWYDRFSTKVGPHAVFAGVAFEEQIVDAIPRQDHDIILDLVITEERVIEIKNPS